MRFLTNSTIGEKVYVENQTFLLLLIYEGGFRFYEANTKYDVSEISAGGRTDKNSQMNSDFILSENNAPEATFKGSVLLDYDSNDRKTIELHACAVSDVQHPACDSPVKQFGVGNLNNSPTSSFFRPRPRTKSGGLNTSTTLLDVGENEQNILDRSDLLLKTEADLTGANKQKSSTVFWGTGQQTFESKNLPNKFNTSKESINLASPELALEQAKKARQRALDTVVCLIVT